MRLRVFIEGGWVDPGREGEGKGEGVEGSFSEEG